MVNYLQKLVSVQIWRCRSIHRRRRRRRRCRCRRRRRRRRRR